MVRWPTPRNLDNRSFDINASTRTEGSICVERSTTAAGEKEEVKHLVELRWRRAPAVK